MPTQMASLFCQQAPDQCKRAEVPTWRSTVLDEGTLRLVRMTWNDIFALEDSQDVPQITESVSLLPTSYLQSGRMGILGEGTGG